MKVRIGLEGARRILAEAAGIVAHCQLDGIKQCNSLFKRALGRARDFRKRSKRKQRKGLVIQRRGVVELAAMAVDKRAEEPILAQIVGAEKAHAVQRRFARRSLPAEFVRFGIDNALPGLHARAPRCRLRRAVQIDQLVETAQFMIRAEAPPEGQSGSEKPVLVTRRPIGKRLGSGLRSSISTAYR